MRVRRLLERHGINMNLCDDKTPKQLVEELQAKLDWYISHVGILYGRLILAAEAHGGQALLSAVRERKIEI